VLRRLQAIPIVRGRWDPSAFEAATRVLREDGSVVIFPEGTRKPVGRPGPAKRGLGALLQMAPAPFLPIYVRGTKELGSCLLRRQRLEMWIGRGRQLHALPVLERTISDAEIQQRVGRLWLACIGDLAERSRLQGPESGS